MTAVIERKEKSVIVVVAKAVSRGFSEIRSLRVGRFGRWAVTQEEGNFDSISIASAVPSVQLHVSRRECCASRVTDASRTHAFSIFYSIFFILLQLQ